MTTTDALNLAKANPDVVSSALSTVSAAVQADPTLIGDVITAVETKSYLPFALKHLGLITQLLGLVSAKPELAAAIGAAVAPK